MEIKPILDYDKKKELIDFLFINEIIKRINVDPYYKDYYRNMLILTILHNTSKSHLEVIGILEELRKEYIKYFWKNV